MDRIVMHVDMDAFFASVEQERRGLDGEPVAVCMYSGRNPTSGAVSTASYEARELGIKSAMPIPEARGKADDADAPVTFIPVDKEYYRDVADRVREEVYEDVADVVEQASIDEAYLDLTGAVESFAEAQEVGREVQEAVSDGYGITCSVGIGPNKLVAKIASDQDKPNGMTAVDPDHVSSFMQSLDLDDIHGIGSKTIQKLHDLDITSVSDLADAPVQLLKSSFGNKQGKKIKKKANGVDEDPVEETEPKQLSRLATLPKNTREKRLILDELDDLVDSLYERLLSNEKWFEAVVLLVIDTDLQMYSRSRSLPTPVQDRDVIMEEGESLLETFLASHDDIKVRRIGIRVTKLSDRSGQRQLGAF